MNAPKNIRIAALGATVVALAAGGAAVAASELHGSSHNATGVAAGTFVSSGAATAAAGHHFDGRHHGDGLAAAATYLGITPAALRTQLESGKTLAQIADATSGKS